MVCVSSNSLEQLSKLLGVMKDCVKGDEKNIVSSSMCASFNLQPTETKDSRRFTLK